MVNWAFIELRPLFEKLREEAQEWEPSKVLPRTSQLGEIISVQLKKYEGGKYRRDRNEASGFFEAITKFTETGLPIGLDHFTGLIEQYRERISPYPHYSGIKLKVPTDFDALDQVTTDDIPDQLQDDSTDDEGSALKLM